MAFSERTIDLTSESDDELEITGSTTLITPKKLPQKNFKTPQSLRTPNNMQTPPEVSGKSSATIVPYHDSPNSDSKGSKATRPDNLINSTWNGFNELRHRRPSAYRTPSPCTQGPLNRTLSRGDAEFSPGERQGKRARERQGSLSMRLKRFRNQAPEFMDRGSAPRNIQTIGEEVRYDEYQESPSPRRKATVEERDHAVIILDDGDNLDELIEISSENWDKISRKKGSIFLDSDYELLDLDDDEDGLLQEIEELARPQNPPLRGRTETIVEQRNLPIALPWFEQKVINTDIGSFIIGDVVELKSSDFFKILMILQNLQSDEIKFRGCQIDRTRQLNGILPKKLNELYFNIEVELDDPRSPMIQGMVEIDLGQVIGVRETRMTNQIFPSCSFRGEGKYHMEQQILEHAPCALRWKYTSQYLTGRDRWHNKWFERSAEHLKYGDISPDDSLALAVNDARVRTRYRGETKPGGAYLGIEASGSAKTSSVEDASRKCDNPTCVIIDDEEPEVKVLRRSVSVVQIADGAEDEGFIPPPTGSSRPAARKPRARLPGQKYTYGDCFCGAGGATRGALMAGLKPIWGFDANAHACSSWKANFPDAVLYEEWADQLIQRGLKSDCLRCDILHLSPPCQYFSPAHTVRGKDDEMNMASLFACGMLLDVAKPRIATLEQTFGIVMLPRFLAYFNSLIQMFTDRGFSIRWRVCMLQNWGLPQRRQRLIVIAACPGEVLPDFPPFTHADPKTASPLPPWVSVNSVIRNIPRGAPDHDIERLEAKPLFCRPWPGDSIAPRCITTHGGQNYHPSGKRGFTLREYACLQGFPMNHKFSTTNVKKQIGNAVPPCIAKVLFSWVKKALEKADGIEPEDEQAEMLSSGHFQTEAIMLD